jgi:hypothetical protein
MNLYYVNSKYVPPMRLLCQSSITVSSTAMESSKGIRAYGAGSSV